MKIWVWLHVVILVILLPGVLQSASLRILTENLPPLNYVKDGALVGPSVEIVKEIQRRIGSTEEIQVYPWARAYKIALEEENVMLFSVSHTPYRENKFKWVGPLATKRDILVAKKGTNLVINSLEDAKKVRRIGVLRNDTKEEYLEMQGFTNLEPVSDEARMPGSSCWDASTYGCSRSPVSKPCANWPASTWMRWKKCIPFAK